MKTNHPSFADRVRQSTTQIVKIVFPGTTNSQGTLFGGTALQWMDEAAGIASIRFSRQTTVTASLDQINFKKPIPEGTIVELIAQVVHVGRTSMRIQVDVFLEYMHQDGREKAITGTFTFVALDDQKQPVPIVWEDSQLSGADG